MNASAVVGNGAKLLILALNKADNLFISEGAQKIINFQPFYFKIECGTGKDTVTV